MFKTIEMENPPERFNVEFWENYGFTANARTTTNGSLSFLLSCMKFPESRVAIMEFAREVAKTDELAARMVQQIEADPRWEI